jgi:hypothetical protein
MSFDFCAGCNDLFELNEDGSRSLYCPFCLEDLDGNRETLFHEIAEISHYYTPLGLTYEACSR